MSSTTRRMGVSGQPGYGKTVDAALDAGVRALSRDDKLSLAWALIDQASSLRTTQEAQRAMSAVEDLYDAEEVDVAPVNAVPCTACETRSCACDDCGSACHQECAANCDSRSRR